jgi:hypothetical protein
LFADGFNGVPIVKERTILFFPDGTAVDKTIFDQPGKDRTSSFTWSLSADGKTLKTEDPQLERIEGPARGRRSRRSSG